MESHLCPAYTSKQMGDACEMLVAAYESNFTLKTKRTGSAASTITELKAVGSPVNPMAIK